MRKDPRVIQARILERIWRIEGFASAGKAALAANRIKQAAVLFNLKMIQETARRLDERYRAAHPEFPWGTLAVTRETPIEYFEGVDLERVWRIVQEDLPGLK